MSRANNINNADIGDDGSLLNRGLVFDTDTWSWVVAPSAGVSGFFLPPYDYIGTTYGATTDVYLYKNGGASGTLVATVTITYTDATKAIIDSVART